MRRVISTAVAVTTLLALVFLATVASAAVERNHATMKAAFRHNALKGAPTTVPSINVTQYLGRWYEVLQDLVTASTFQRNSFCAIAEYGVDESDPSHITVTNWEHYGNVTGPIDNVTGYAYQPDPVKAPGQLVVYLFGAGASPFPAPYWVLRLGPVVNDKYEYAIVSDPLRATLFVLVRDVARYEANYKADILSWLASNGFDQFWNSPIELPQANCTYPPSA